jgi:hypothetical protein
MYKYFEGKMSYSAFASLVNSEGTEAVQLAAGA